MLEAVCSHASFVVVMTQHARETLLATASVPSGKVRVIPHGARTPDVTARTVQERVRPALLTWGLISPGKGLEWSIRAVADLAASGTLVDYVIAGQTHPKLVAEHGEAYRDSLVALVHRLGLADQVTFVDRYLSPATLDALIGDADAVVLPYESVDQATSGVLAEAVAAGIPVVATGFPHAIELLAEGAGVVVPHRDPAAIAAGVLQILRREGGASSSTAPTDTMSWTTVDAPTCSSSAACARSRRHDLDDDPGAVICAPERADGRQGRLRARRVRHRTPRARLLRGRRRARADRRLEEPDQTPGLARLAKTYLRFLETTLEGDGRFHNRMAESGL